MTAPMSLREYFAAAGSAYTKADAEVIGPQIECLAEEGDASERRIVDTAASANSPLHAFFDWDDASAADKHRLQTAGTMLRSIRVRTLEDDRPRVSPAYRVQRASPRSALKGGYNVLHGESAGAVQKAKEAFDELTAWRTRYAPFVLVWARLRTDVPGGRQPDRRGRGRRAASPNRGRHRWCPGGAAMLPGGADSLA